jgi:hypothetical protein
MADAASTVVEALVHPKASATVAGGAVSTPQKRGPSDNGSAR